MKRKIKNTIIKFIGLFYKQFIFDPEYPIKKLFLFLFLQKIIGINRHVPWPVHFTSQVKSPQNIKSKTEVLGYAMGNYIDARNGIIVEENVWLGPKVSIISQNHDLTDYDKYIETKPIKIGRDSLLLTNCVILPGVELGEHTIVAAGTIVHKSFLQGNVVIAGNPAMITKRLAHYKKNTNELGLGIGK